MCHSKQRAALVEVGGRGTEANVRRPDPRKRTNMVRYHGWVLFLGKGKLLVLFCSWIFRGNIYAHYITLDFRFVLMYLMLIEIDSNKAGNFLKRIV